jgi:hypothetical protein
MDNNLEFDFTKNKGTYNLSQQAITALLMTLQKCLAEQIDITDLLGDWKLYVKEGELTVVNPPAYAVPKEFNPETEEE